jgi:probable HAF family extracellular repeat protein
MRVLASSCAVIAMMLLLPSFAASQPVVVDLGTLGGTSSHAWAVNASGQVVGESRLSGDTMTHPFLWTAAGAPHRPKYVAYLVAPVRAFSAVGGPQLRAVAAAQPAANLAVPVKGSLRTSVGGHTQANIWREPAPAGLAPVRFLGQEHYVIVEPET